MAMEGCFAGFGCLLGGLSAASVRLRRPAPKVDPSAIKAIGHRFVVLPDGRKLEYTVGGDPDGFPVYYQHGYAGSCMLPESWENVARRWGLRLIAASMPGFGLSDSYPLGTERSLLDWPADVLAVLNKEGVTKAHFIGISAGCVHIAALAYGLPPEMVGNICFATPTYPDSTPEAHRGISRVTWATKVLMGTPYVGDLFAYLLAAMPSMQRMSVAPDVKAALRRMREEMPDVFEDVIAFTDHSVSATYRGLVDNLGTITKPLPFHLERVGALIRGGRSITITSSDDDTTNPPAMQLAFRSHLPRSTIMKFEDGWGHLHAVPPAHFERILRFLISGHDPDLRARMMGPCVLGSTAAFKATGMGNGPCLLGSSVMGKAVGVSDKA